MENDDSRTVTSEIRTSQAHGCEWLNTVGLSLSVCLSVADSTETAGTVERPGLR